MRIETALIHAGEYRPRIEGAVAMPVFQSSTFEYDGAGDYHDVRYIRLSNTPNHAVLHAKLAALESAEAALVTASGMAAVSSTLLSLLSHGDHVLAHRTLYGGTHDLITKDLPRMGIEHTFVDADAPETWASAIRPDDARLLRRDDDQPACSRCSTSAASPRSAASGASRPSSTTRARHPSTFARSSTASISSCTARPST